MVKSNPNIIYQFRFELVDIEPLIWRSVQVPSKYTFWDLHVAIQDSMGWLDYHLHLFRIRWPHKRNYMEIGIPMDDDDFDDEPFIPGWEVPLTDYFIEPGKSAHYQYDFGDTWDHNILLEAILLKDKTARYPKCVAGERACPPEDCGGVSGYYNLLEILKNPWAPEYREHIEWLKGHAKNYYPYEPDRFSPAGVKFDNPKKRWQKAFF